MDQNPSSPADENRVPNDNRKSKASAPVINKAPPKPKKQSYMQRWNAMQISKTVIAWLSLATIIGTMLVGFTWGGWVTGSSAQEAATKMSNDTVAQRLSSICVAQFQQDPAKGEKLVELQAARGFDQRKFVSEQGWATMPGDEESDSNVASACAKMLAEIE